MKKFIIVLMALVVAIALTGCGGGGSKVEEHWGDKGTNLDDDINTNYILMKKAFVPETVNPMTTDSQRKTHIATNFTDFIKDGAIFMGNPAFTKDKMNSRMASVLKSYNIVTYGCEIGETAKISDTKYTSWVYCQLYATRKTDGEVRNSAQWMQLTWEKAADNKWYITAGFNNEYWFKGSSES